MLLIVLGEIASFRLFPCLFPFVWLAFFGDYIISSATGVQQRDPLGPVLFSLAIHSLASELVSYVVS